MPIASDSWHRPSLKYKRGTGYTDDKISPDGFGALYKPMEKGDRQLSQSLPQLEAEVDALKINRISAAEVIEAATDLSQSWPRFTTPERRCLVESITEKIVVIGDSVDVNL